MQSNRSKQKFDQDQYISSFNMRKSSVPTANSRSFLRLNGQNVLDSIDVRDYYPDRKVEH